MNPNRFTRKVSLAIACCLIILVPLLVAAQTPGGIIKKGAHGVQKGVETGAQKTKEGAEAVGKDTKDFITGKDTNTGNSRMKSTEAESSTTPSQTTTRDTTSGTKDTGRRGAGKNRLPSTAGELPLLAFAGGLSLAAAAASKLVHRSS